MLSKKNIFPLRYCLGFILICLLTSLSGQNDAPIDDRIQDLWNGAETVSCIVKFDKADLNFVQSHWTKKQKGRVVFNTLQSWMTKTQKDVNAFLESNKVDHVHLSIINSIQAELSRDLILEVAQFPFVEKIIHNSTFQMTFPLKPSAQNELRAQEITWGNKMIKADSVWEMGYFGQGVVVGGEDTGIKWNIPSIENQYRGNAPSGLDHNYNWHDAIHEINPLNRDSVISPDNNPCGLDTKAPCDDNGHGTHTVGTMVGLDNDTLIGVAPEAQWIGCRCMERGWGALSTYTECFEWFLAPTDSDNNNPNPDFAPHVINNSWVCPVGEGCNSSNWSVMEEAADNLKAAGIMVVASAGNDGSRGCSSIANPAAMFESVFTVGASAQNDSITGFSSKGSIMADGSNRIKPNVVAPGARVKSQLPDSSYRSWNGTSMAGPHVAGLVALIISANPKLSGRVEIIEDIIESTAIRKFSPIDSCDIDPFSIPNNVYGYGRVDALAAVKKALEFIPSNTTQPTIDIMLNNPIKDELIIKWNGDHVLSKISILTIEGKTVKSLNNLSVTGKHQMDVSPLSSGIYILNLNFNDIQESIKLIKI